jgi:Raf kinase inhibitor-like YbhB/YbcL family protein
VLLAASACDTDDGRSLDAPPPGVTAPELPTSSTATTTPPPDVSLPGPAEVMALASAAFAPDTAIPARFTCDAENVSPPLSWTGVPPDAVELALVVHDPDAPGGDFLHWVVTGIDPTVTGIAEGGLPETAVEVRSWTGPCPPPGAPHGYVFVLYALPVASGLTPEADAELARNTLESLSAQIATFTATYGRPA